MQKLTHEVAAAVSWCAQGHANNFVRSAHDAKELFTMHNSWKRPWAQDSSGAHWLGTRSRAGAALHWTAAVVLEQLQRKEGAAGRRMDSLFAPALVPWLKLAHWEVSQHDLAAEPSIPE
mmetsp:Transcript_23993/g.76575  ORF Transcript_23993/g.76575 Transcript_23993/m.76575 type:complete len:119 (+) Transcript_23993:69-425(+)